MPQINLSYITARTPRAHSFPPLRGKKHPTPHTIWSAGTFNLISSNLRAALWCAAGYVLGVHMCACVFVVRFPVPIHLLHVAVASTYFHRRPSRKLISQSTNTYSGSPIRSWPPCCMAAGCSPLRTKNEREKEKEREREKERRKREKAYYYLTKHYWHGKVRTVPFRMCTLIVEGSAFDGEQTYFPLSVVRARCISRYDVVVSLFSVMTDTPPRGES